MNNGELNNANNVPSLANILNNDLIIQSHTTINEDERLQSYCRLKLINMLSPKIGKPTHSAVAQTTYRQEAGCSTSNYQANTSAMRAAD
ncbi:hypothetical protein OROMI_004227 [Orobanche minor]